MQLHDPSFSIERAPLLKQGLATGMEMDWELRIDIQALSGWALAITDWTNHTDRPESM